jgi:signal transduction histidine kinase
MIFRQRARAARADRVAPRRGPAPRIERDRDEGSPSLLGSLVLVTATVVLAAMLVLQPHPSGSPRLPWWLLTLAFAAAELEGVNSRSRRAALTAPSSRIPLVIGLVLNVPLQLITAQMAGLALVRVMRNDVPPRAMVFELAGSGFATALGAATYLWMAGEAAAGGPHSWLDAVVAAAVVVLVSTLLGWVRAGRFVRFAAQIHPTVASFGVDVGGIAAGLLATEILQSDRHGVVLLVVPGLMVALGRRRRRRAAWRADALARLHEVACSLHRAVDPREMAVIVLGQVPALTLADEAGLVLADGPDRVLDGHATDGQVEVSTRPVAEADRSRWARLGPTGLGVAASRRDVLEVGVVEAGVVTGTLWVRAPRRLPRGFTRAENDVLETLVTNLGAQLETVRRLDELGRRHEMEAASVRRLRSLNEELAQVNAAKSVFLAATSHELRAPLSALLAGTEVLGSSVSASLDHEIVQRLADAAHDNARRVLRLVDDLLDLSRIEAGHLTLCPEPADLADIAASVTSTFGPVAAERGVRLRFERAAPVPVVGDPGRLWQVMANLVDNAIKAAAAGGSVMVRASITDAAAQVCVVDTGIGIGPDDLARIFEPFEQVTPRRGGLGLGLPIARYLVERHGGTLTVHSRPGVGSRFTVRLVPAGRPPSPPRSGRRHLDRDAVQYGVAADRVDAQPVGQHVAVRTSRLPGDPLLDTGQVVPEAVRQAHDPRS